MQFTFNEGHIQLPSQWQDQSMQVLVSTDNSGINLVITREAVPQGTLTPELYQETLALYQGKLDGYHRTCLPGNHSGRGPGLAAGLFLERSGR